MEQRSLVLALAHAIADRSQQVLDGEADQLLVVEVLEVHVEDEHVSAELREEQVGEVGGREARDYWGCGGGGLLKVG